jgi:23S rRNA pseudouridine1911/1915/1917 synthase
MPPSALAVLFEDESLIALDKPAGVHTAPLRADEADTLLAQVIERFPEVGGVPGVKPVEPGLVHRLDRETSGVVVVARTAEAFSALRAQFEAGETLKEYRAVCRSDAAVSTPMRLSVQSRFAAFGPGRRMVRVVLPDTRGARVLREASLVVYSTEARIEAREGERVFLSAQLRVGFRHQVRAHLSHLGYPIYGDPLYGVPVPEGAPVRMYLHASGISLRHPVTGEPMRLVSEVPEAFQTLLTRR